MPRRSDYKPRTPKRITCLVCGVTKPVGAGFKSARSRVCFKCQGKTRKTTTRIAYVGKTYHLHPAEYKALHAKAVADHCSLCGRRADTYRQFSVDHDHQVEAEVGMRYSIRAEICRSCNKLLALAGDSSSLLRRAADYLDNWPSMDLFDFVVGHTVDRDAA